jgi:BON domain
MKPIISDTILRDAVVNELERDPEVFAKHISVTATDGAITLGGHVMTYHEKHVAVRAAERVPAVRAVADEIEVRDPALHEARRRRNRRAGGASKTRGRSKPRLGLSSSP